MIEKLSEYRDFCAEFWRQYKLIVRNKGWRYGWAFTKCWWIDFHIIQKEKKTANFKVVCPICGWKGFDFRMLNCGWFSVPHVECPQCESHERHRMLHLYLTRHRPEFFNNSGLLLHFAFEPHVRTLIEMNPNIKCLTTDYAWYMVENHQGKGFQADMQNMPIKDNSFDSVFCLHVLEHVPDDNIGIAEIERILKHGGVAYIMVPFMMDWKKTIEFGKPDPTIFDHVRGYSPNDFIHRLNAFEYDEIKPMTFLSSEEILKFRIPDSQVIYRCIKK